MTKDVAQNNNDPYSNWSLLIETYPGVYFIQSKNGGPIKIGFSSDYERRLKEIQSNSPVKLRVLATIRGTIEKEKELHHLFRNDRLHGEWFNPSPELLQFILNILLGDIE